MATKIAVNGKIITIPKTPYLVQTDENVEHFQFEINEPDVDLSTFDFYLSFKTSKNSASIQPLPNKLVDRTTGIITLDWVPDEEFTAVNGYTDIQLVAMVGQTRRWNTRYATVYVYNELLNTAAAQLNPKTPTLFLYYLHVMQGIQKDVHEIYETFMNNPTITVDANTGVPSAEISVQGTGTDKHYHFDFHNLKGEPGSGGGNWGSITGDINTQTDLMDKFATKQNQAYHQDTEPTGAVEGDLWLTDESGGSGNVEDVLYTKDGTTYQSAVVNQKAYLDLNWKEVFHQDTEPTEAQEGDLWVTDGGTEGNVKDVKTSRDGITYNSVVDASGDAKISFAGYGKVYHQDTTPSDAISGDLWLTDGTEPTPTPSYTGENGIVVDTNNKIKLNPVLFDASGNEFKVTGDEIVLVKNGVTYKLSNTTKQSDFIDHIHNTIMHLEINEHNKLMSIEAGAQKNVRSDLTETDVTKDSYVIGREPYVNHIANTSIHMSTADRTKLDGALSSTCFNYNPSTGVIEVTL